MELYYRLYSQALPRCSYVSVEAGHLLTVPTMPSSLGPSCRCFTVLEWAIYVLQNIIAAVYECHEFGKLDNSVQWNRLFVGSAKEVEQWQQ
jgi:hypothetical protein